MNKTLRAHLALLGANLIYGANYTIAKEVVPVFIKPFGFIVIRVLTVLFLFLIAHPFFTREKVQRKDIFKFVACGIFGVALNQLCFLKGLSLTTPIHAALIMTTTPILVLVIAGIVLKEMVTTGKVSGILLGSAGAIILILLGKNANTRDGANILLGDIFVFINAMSWGIYLVIARPLMQRYHPATIMKMMFFFGAFFVVPVGYNDLLHVEWGTWSAPVWLAATYVIVGATFFAYLLNNIGLQSLSSPVVSIYIYMQPLLAAMIAITFGKDQITLLHVVSAVLIFTGVYLVSRVADRSP